MVNLSVSQSLGRTAMRNAPRIRSALLLEPPRLLRLLLLHQLCEPSHFRCDLRLCQKGFAGTLFGSLFCRAGFAEVRLVWVERHDCDGGYQQLAPRHLLRVNDHVTLLERPLAQQLRRIIHLRPQTIFHWSPKCTVRSLPLHTPRQKAKGWRRRAPRRARLVIRLSFHGLEHLRDLGCHCLPSCQLLSFLL